MRSKSADAKLHGIQRHETGLKLGTDSREKWQSDREKLVIFCQFRSKLAITHTIAIKWKEKYDDCHHTLHLCGDRIKMSLPQKVDFYIFFKETPSSPWVPFRKNFRPPEQLFCPSCPLAYSLMKYGHHFNLTIHNGESLYSSCKWSGKTMQIHPSFSRSSYWYILFSVFLWAN